MYKGYIIGFLGIVEWDGEIVVVNYGGGRWSVKVLCYVILWLVGGFIVVGENGGIY